MVKSGDSCQKVLDQNGISLKEFVTWNPDVGTTCTGLWLDTYVCVSIIGHSPSPVDPDNGIATPTPTQPGMVKNCNKFYKVTKGDSCDSIARKSNIPLDDFVKWNTGVGGKACSGLWLDTYVCISVVGYTPTPPPPTQTTQPGIAKECNKLYQAKTGDTCEGIVKQYDSFVLSEL